MSRYTKFIKSNCFSKYCMWCPVKLYFSCLYCTTEGKRKKLKEHTEKKHGKDIQEKPNLKF